MYLCLTPPLRLGKRSNAKNGCRKVHRQQVRYIPKIRLYPYISAPTQHRTLIFSILIQKAWPTFLESAVIIFFIIQNNTRNKGIRSFDSFGVRSFGCRSFGVRSIVSDPANIPQVILHAIDFFQNYQKILPP